MALGRQNPGRDAEPFNMAYLAIRGSGAVNGVSRLHGQVSRKLFQAAVSRAGRPTKCPLGTSPTAFTSPPGIPPRPIGLWTDSLRRRHAGAATWRTWSRISAGIDDAELWRMRTDERRVADRISFATAMPVQVAAQGGSPQEIAAAGQAFDFDALDPGFARRFAIINVPNLLLHDPERLMRILLNPRAPVQLLLAGKAHPQDEAGQAMIRQWNSFIRRAGTPSPVIFLSDYDMLLTERLAGGVDVWINTPRRPWEASGTSGMKVLVNGGLNVSELDGWWAEAYSPEVGWALGDGREHGDVDPAGTPSKPRRCMRCSSAKSSRNSSLSGGRIPYGQQHSTLVSIAGTLRARRVCDEAIEACLKVINARRCEKPGAPENIARIVRSSRGWGQWHER